MGKLKQYVDRLIEPAFIIAFFTVAAGFLYITQGYEGIKILCTCLLVLSFATLLFFGVLCLIKNCLKK